MQLFNSQKQISGGLSYDCDIDSQTKLKQSKCKQEFCFENHKNTGKITKIERFPSERLDVIARKDKISVNVHYLFVHLLLNYTFIEQQVRR